MNKKVLIWGYGSIGKKHEKAFSEHQCEVGILSQREHPSKICFSDLGSSLTSFKPDVIVICNKTSEHQTSLEQLNTKNFGGIVLVEKPLFKNFSETEFPNLKFLYVGYNLRFHGVLSKLKEELSDKNIISAMVYCGQYLPEWRPGTDYRESYSAKKELGGGVLRDLSHELDYSCWLFGNPINITAIGGKFSSLEINSDDTFSIMAQTERCSSLNISINYLDRHVQREIVVICDDSTYKADVLNSKLYKNGELINGIHLIDTYSEQAKSVLENKLERNCTYNEGLNINKLIEVIEKSSNEKIWIKI